MPEPERPSLTSPEPHKTPNPRPPASAPAPSPTRASNPRLNPHPRQVELLLMRALSLQLIRGKTAPLKVPRSLLPPTAPEAHPLARGCPLGPKGRALSLHGC